MIADDKNVNLETFSTHFFTNETDKHFISAEDYKVFIDSIEETLADINTKLLNSRANYKLCIVANKEGGFWSIFGLTVSLVGGSFAILDSGFVHGFYKELTGHDYDTAEIGKKAAVFMKDITVGLFSKTATQLSKIIPTELNFDKAINAKNKFYRMCGTSTDIVGVSFSDSIEPEIQKKDFVHYISQDTDSNLPPEQFVDVVTIVKSVNVDSDAKWSVKVGDNTKPQYVDMLDEDFRKDFLAGKYALKQTKQDDKMKVLLEKKKKYENGREKDMRLAIVKVYEFNNAKILPVPPDMVQKVHQPKIDLFNFQNHLSSVSSVQSETNH